MEEIQVTVVDSQEVVSLFIQPSTASVLSVNGNTGDVVLDPDDLDDTATTNKFVTASDITLLGNTSGTNTGDQDLSGKQDNITLTTTGTSGAATFAGDVLNIPQYSGGGGSVLSTTVGEPAGSDTIRNIVSLTKAEYDAGSPVLDTHYLITDATPPLASLLEDTTPQAGGELDMNGHSIVGEAQATTGTGATTIDWRLGNAFNFQFGAFNETFTFTAPSKAGTFILKLVQDSVGSRTVTLPGTVKWTSAGLPPTLTETATTGTDIITFYFDGTNYFAVDALNFA